MTEFNELLLRLGISTTGLAFGMSVPVFFRLMVKSLYLRESLHARAIAWLVVLLIVASTAFMILFEEHVTARRVFLLAGTSAACVALYLVRDVGSGSRREDE